MSLKRLLIIILVSVVVLSISLFAFISNRYMNDYFDEYIEGVFEENLDNIVDYCTIILNGESYHRTVLNSYVKDPIYYVEIYDLSNNLVSYSGTGNNQFIMDESIMTISLFDVEYESELIGYVSVVHAKDSAYSGTKQVFSNALLSGGIIALLIIFLVSGVVLYVIIRAISKETNRIVDYSQNENVDVSKYKINEFGIISDAIKSYRERLMLKEKVKKEKLDTILHKTKTPITVIKSQLEGIVDKIIKFDDDRNETMLNEINKLDTLLLDITDIIEGKESYSDKAILKTVDYSSNLQRIVVALSSKFSKKGLKLEYDKKPFNINTDSKVLDGVIYNLLMNSYKYTNIGYVKIKSEKKEIIIEDTGVGIPKDDTEHIFEPYFRAKNAKNIEGQGLGLYNVKQELSDIGVEIQVESKENEFTIISLIFDS